MVERLLTIALDQFATYVSNILVQHLPTKKNSMAYLYLGLVLVPPLSMYRPMRQGMMESSFSVEQLMDQTSLLLALETMASTMLMAGMETEPTGISVVLPKGQSKGPTMETMEMPPLLQQQP